MQASCNKQQRQPQSVPWVSKLLVLSLKLLVLSLKLLVLSFFGEALLLQQFHSQLGFFGEVLGTNA